MIKEEQLSIYSSHRATIRENGEWVNALPRHSFHTCFHARETLWIHGAVPITLFLLQKQLSGFNAARGISNTLKAHAKAWTGDTVTEVQDNLTSDHSWVYPWQIPSSLLLCKRKWVGLDLGCLGSISVLLVIVPPFRESAISFWPFQATATPGRSCFLLQLHFCPQRLPLRGQRT